MAEATSALGVTVIGKGAGKGDLSKRPGVAPTTGFQAVQVVISGCSNEPANGIYLPAVPYAEKPVWHKAGTEASDDESKDTGDRFLYFSQKIERWYIGDALEEGGFTFVPAAGQCFMPPARGWNSGTNVQFQATTPDGDLDAPAALRALDQLSEVEPWADQELCYVTMLKVLGNIVANPGEAKFSSLKIENPAIQNKILRFNGARAFLEATGFRENAGALVLPLDRHQQAKLSQEMLQSFANECNYQNIRKERHAKAREAAKEEEEKASWAAARAKAAKSAEESGGGGGKRMGGG
eukprot:TRINITY_DN41809_c0_g1_i1.p1 TRINITY_DN41809_c0_g1~~TRINITY_DN41809_c0_g1_i1.p1  ORF type:complete len:309 (-),score=81.42 TRINITY_DN41809_c0_g1_i1:144-1028(-)